MPDNSARTSAANRRSISRCSINAAAIERRHDTPRGLCRPFHVRHQILHDAGAGMQLPVAELLQDDRAQQFVVGRRHSHGRCRPQPGRQIGQARSTNEPAASRTSAAGGRRARASDCRDGTAPAPGARSAPSTTIAGEAAAISDRSATLLPSRSVPSTTTAPARAAQMRARWVLPQPVGPLSASAGAGQSGQRSIQASASRLPPATTKSSRA